MASVQHATRAGWFSMFDWIIVKVTAPAHGLVLDIPFLLHWQTFAGLLHY
jgi:hypothetical protein